jgi:hypothetical protein
MPVETNIYNHFSHRICKDFFRQNNQASLFYLVAHQQAKKLGNWLPGLKKGYLALINCAQKWTLKTSDLCRLSSQKG